ncbi:MAG TPA: hypothetical protein VEG08_13215 [Terriglobales bacterium]|nr:hypothetical protein [Terriglobales bacterium]
MKTLAVVMLMVLLPAALVAQTQHLKFKQDGEFASLNESTGPNSSFNLQVSRTSSTGSGASATLSYLATSLAPDFSSFSFDQIVGDIPASSFTGQNTQHLVLAFDTSQLDPATSFSQSCTVDLNTFTEVCGPGPQGQINLEFRENGAQRTQILALEQVTTLGPTTTRNHQKSDNSSANAQGTVFGAPVVGSNATVGVNHSSTLEMIVSQ